MRNLGDQIAVVFENESLLRSTATTLDEVQTLYNINRAMLSALDPLGVLRALRNHMAQDAYMILRVVVERDRRRRSAGRPAHHHDERRADGRDSTGRLEAQRRPVRRG